MLNFIISQFNVKLNRKYLLKCNNGDIEIILLQRIVNLTILKIFQHRFIIYKNKKIFFKTYNCKKHNDFENPLLVN